MTMSERLPEPHVHCLIQPTTTLVKMRQNYVPMTAWRLECSTCGAVEKFYDSDRGGIAAWDLKHADCGDK